MAENLGQLAEGEDEEPEDQPFLGPMSQPLLPFGRDVRQSEVIQRGHHG